MSNVIPITSRRGPVDAKSRTVTFILTNAVQDRAGDTVAMSGWKLDNYLRNPVILWGHDHDEPAIGRMSRLAVEGDSLVGDVQFADADTNPFADTIFRLVEGGFISAGSVGFIPLKWSYRENDRGIDWLEQELIEYSICNVPMNPTALARAVAGGIDLAPLAKRADVNSGSYAELVTKLLASNAPPTVSTPNLDTLQRRARANAARLALAP